MNRSNDDTARRYGPLFFGNVARGATPAQQDKDNQGMVVNNPAPDASEPAVANGVYQEIKLRSLSYVGYE